MKKNLINYNSSCGFLKIACVWGIALVFCALNGCATLPVVDQTVQAERAREQGVADAADAMRLFREEGVRASIENRKPQYTVSYRRFREAIERLRSLRADADPKTALIFEALQSVRVAMAAVIVAEGASDDFTRADAWAQFDAAAQTVLFAFSVQK